jgi:hypothetical protein
MAGVFPDGIRTGKINYQNFLKRFLDLGFNNADCINELIDNAIDAGAKNVVVNLVSSSQGPKTPSYFLELVDDGQGMDEALFAKYFEMFGDKDDVTLQSLGKKGIGGKVALVTLSKLNDTLVVSKQANDELLYSKQSWGKLREAGNICINHASKLVEELWDDTQPVNNKGHGTIIRINLTSSTHEDLDELISREQINERNVYYTACRNYFRQLQDGLSITFMKTVNDEKQASIKCVPLDPLHLDEIESPTCKGVDIIRLYINPKANQRPELLVQRGTEWEGYVQNKLCSHKMKIWSPSDIEPLIFLGELKLEHSFLTYDYSDKEKVKGHPKQSLGERHILEKMFPGAKFTKDGIMSITLGTHLERNKKETGLLLSPFQKKTGDFAPREFINQSRHRLIFNCTANNDDIIDQLFQTQINKSKVDAKQLPTVISKTIQTLNEEFGLMVFNSVTSYSNNETTIVEKVAQDVKQEIACTQASTSTATTIAMQSKNLENTVPKKINTDIKRDTMTALNKDTSIQEGNPLLLVEPNVVKTLDENVTSHPLLKSDVVPLDQTSKDSEETTTVKKYMSEKILLYQIIQLSELIATKDIVNLEACLSEDNDKHLLCISEYIENLYTKMQSV